MCLVPLRHSSSRGDVISDLSASTNGPKRQGSLQSNDLPEKASSSQFIQPRWLLCFLSKKQASEVCCFLL